MSREGERACAGAATLPSDNGDIGGAPGALDRAASELRALLPAGRYAIPEAAAALAEGEYRNNPEWTAFEAFGPDDVHGDSSGPEAR